MDSPTKEHLLNDLKDVKACINNILNPQSIAINMVSILLNKINLLEDKINMVFTLCSC